MLRQLLPLDQRTELRDLIDDDLLATLARTSSNLAARFTREWFRLVSLLGDARRRRGRCVTSSARPRPVIPGYTEAVKTAVSIPDDVFEAADRLARRRRMSRSSLYAEALQLLLIAHTGDNEITAQLDAVYADVDSALDPAIDAAQADALREPW